MSKIRQRNFTFADELPPHADGVVRSYVVYTARKDDAPHRYAGYLNAPDIALAVSLACEHYGQDEACTGIWVHDVQEITETPCAMEKMDPQDTSDTTDCESDPEWVVFGQKRRGDIHVESALSRAVARHGGGMVQIRVVPHASIHATEPGQLIWRTHDQTYRMARGYSKSVRLKWEAVRKAEDIDEYRKDDIKDHF
jgi:1,2-phenylacetyl-CoA epoxidase PaaB subunit